MIQTANINRLFLDLWPAMPYCNINHQLCLSQSDKIESRFGEHGKDFDKLLQSLIKINGIGLTIASGLIWSVYRNEAVPFDKYTMAHALSKGILRSAIISTGRYTKACQKIVEYCIKKEDETQMSFTIEDFVREAPHQGYEYSIEPS